MFLKAISVPSYTVRSDFVPSIKSKKYLPPGKFPFVQENRQYSCPFRPLLFVSAIARQGPLRVFWGFLWCDWKNQKY
jgi:hypothetical protein